MSDLISLPLTHGPVTFPGAVSLEITPPGVQPWRLVHDRIDLFEPSVRGRCVCPAGVRVALVSDTRSLEVEADSPPCINQYDPEEWTFDLTVDGRLHQRIKQPKTRGLFRFTDIPTGGDEKRLEVWLDLARPVRIKRVGIEAGARARPFIDPRPKWIVYGSSITHCCGVPGPTETWPALVAGRFGLNLTCLGLGGNCHLEPVFGRIMRDLPADLVSMCLGINVAGQASLNSRTFRANVIGLIDAVRDGHPGIPLAIVSPICNPPRETTPNAVGMTLERMRAEIRDAVETFRRLGDPNLHYIDGLELFGPEFVPLMPDQLHPGNEGCRVLAGRYGDIVMPKLGRPAPVVP